MVGMGCGEDGRGRARAALAARVLHAGSGMGNSLARAAILTLTLLFLAGCGTDHPIDYKIHCDYTVSDPQFAQTMGSLLGPPLQTGNSVSTLRNGDEIFPPMLSAI